MINMAMYRGWALSQMREGLGTYGTVLQLATDDDVTRWRDGGDGWTVTEVLCHIRDFESVFFERAKLTATQDVPDLLFPDPDELAAQNHYAADNINDVYAAWESTRHEHVAYLESLSDEMWECVGKHPKRGDFTLNDQLMLTARHDVLHLHQISKILKDKQA